MSDKANVFGIAIAMVMIFNEVNDKNNHTWLRQYRLDTTLWLFPFLPVGISHSLGLARPQGEWELNRGSIFLLVIDGFVLNDPITVNVFY